MIPHEHELRLATHLIKGKQSQPDNQSKTHIQAEEQTIEQAFLSAVRAEYLEFRCVHP